MQGRELAAHARALNLPAEPDPAAAHLETLKVMPFRGDISGKP